MTSETRRSSNPSEMHAINLSILIISILINLSRHLRLESNPRVDKKRTSSKKTHGYPTANTLPTNGRAAHIISTISQEIKPSTETGQMSLIQTTQATNPTSHTQSFQSLPMTLGEERYYYPDGTECLVAIMSGATSLGVEVPEYLQGAFLDEDGQSMSWSVAGEAASVYGVQYLSFDSSLRFNLDVYQQVMRYEHNGMELEDFAGIGAQFDYEQGR
jgi:hypothetical protein